MAEKVVVTRTMADDLDGTEWDPDDEGAGRTVMFAWQGKDYRIDLKAANADEFDKMMDRYVQHAMRTGAHSHTGGAPRSTASGSRRRGGGQGMGRSKEELAEMRKWLREHGHDVADSGLVPKKLQEIYDKRDTEPQIPSTQASAAARAPGKAPAFSAPAVPAPAGKVSPLDSLIPPVTAVVRGSDSR